MKKINLQDILKIETLGDDVRLVLLHMKSRIWPLSLTKDALQFAMSIQRNMKVRRYYFFSGRSTTNLFFCFIFHAFLIVDISE